MNEQEVNQLFTTFSAGRTPGSEDFNASRLFTLLEDPFSIWCNFHAPQEEAVPEPNRYENLKIRTDRSARDGWIREEFPTVFFVTAQDDTERFKNTLAAMARGETAIANASLWNLQEHVYGGVNLLVRVNGTSRFGNYYYTIYQFKRAHDLKEHYSLQVTLLNQILGQIQGITPANMRIFLKGHTVDVPYTEHLERLQSELPLKPPPLRGVYTPINCLCKQKI